MGRFILNNPYEDIDWNDPALEDRNISLHTHTRYSDGARDPNHRIFDYEDEFVAPNIYSGLSLTDHDTGHYNQHPYTLWPWSNLAGIYNTIKDMVSPVWEETWEDASFDAWENVLPLGFVAIEGCEVTRPRHILSHFCDFAGELSTDYEYIFNEIKDRGGLATFAHPGRYTDDDEDELLGFYSDMFIRHAALWGLEIFNKKNRHPRDERMWDNLLMITLPDKPIWAFSNDDNHDTNSNWDYGVSWNCFPLLDTDFNEAGFKAAYEKGAFFACNIRGDNVSSGGLDGLRYVVPACTGIEVTNKKIIVSAGTALNPVDRIRWVVDGETAKIGDAVGDNMEFDFSNLSEGKYVRFVLIADWGEVGSGELGGTWSQPFTLSKPRVQVVNPGNIRFWKAEVFSHDSRHQQYKQGEVRCGIESQHVPPMYIDLAQGQTTYWWRTTFDHRPFGVSKNLSQGFDDKWVTEGWGEGSFEVSYPSKTVPDFGQFIRTIQQKISRWFVSRFLYVIEDVSIGVPLGEMEFSGIDATTTIGVGKSIEVPIGTTQLIGANPHVVGGTAPYIEVNNLPEMEFDKWDPLITISDVGDADIYISSAPRIGITKWDVQIDIHKEVVEEVPLGEMGFEGLDPTVVAKEGTEIHIDHVPYGVIGGRKPEGIAFERSIYINAEPATLIMRGRLPQILGQRDITVEVGNLPTMWMDEPLDGPSVEKVRNIKLIPKTGKLYLQGRSPLLDRKVKEGDVRVIYFPHWRHRVFVFKKRDPSIAVGKSATIEIGEMPTMTMEGIQDFRIQYDIYLENMGEMAIEALNPTLEVVAYPRQFRRDKIKGRKRQGVII